MNTIQLETAPRMSTLYLRALMARGRGPVPEDMQVLGSISLKGQRIDNKRLQAYRRICGFGNEDHIPPTYPFVLAVPLHLRLLVSEAFPCSVLGVVHVANEIIQYRVIKPGDALDFECTLSGARPVRRGFEFEMVTRVSVGGILVWECISTLLSRDQRARTKARRPERAIEEPLVADAVSPWTVPGDTGRRYARVSGDSNPIHLYALTAKLFGFPRAIAHGMWTKARCLAELEQTLSMPPFDQGFRVCINFRQPVYLPAQVQFEYSADEGLIKFAVSKTNEQKLYLSGQVSAL
ncbi:MaoC/PaaZ C-terminal domain-containing protein [Microbulbifer aggregans]|uniref:MaoC/PaaZ C-terminal domain-containing protein n=1 Tax=Microbulbifer aggregans TaxID=1769779 RepID=UPI001CFCBAB0|nr:MaoC/PaaZ C-terminal domain-containing protein [Microbulbifer aggregans]